MKLEFNSEAPVFTNVVNDIPVEITEEKYPADIAELLHEGIKAAQNDRRAEARSFLYRVTEMDSENEPAWLWLASISEYPEELLGFLNNVLKINPENERAIEWKKATKSLLSKTFVQRGIDASNENQKDFARQCFRQAIHHDEQSEMAWLWLAASADSDEEKTEYLQKVLDINPESETAQTSLKSLKKQSAEMLLRQAFAAAADGENELSLDILEEVLSEELELKDAWMLRSFLIKSFAEKSECFARVLEFDPENDLALANLEFLRTVTEKVELEEVAENVPEYGFDNQEEEFAEDKMNTDELEIPENLADEKTAAEIPNMPKSGEIDQPEELFDDEDIEKLTDMFEQNPNEAVYASFDAEEIEESQAAFDQDQPEYAEKDESLVEEFEDIDDLPPVHAFEEAEKQVIDEEDYSIHDTETASDYSDFNRAQNWDDEMLEETPVAFENQAEEIFSAEESESDFTQESETAEQDFFQEEAGEIFAEENTREFQPETFACPFCSAENEPQTLVCSNCHAAVSLSDLEILLANHEADKETIGDAVRQMEAENARRDLETDELKILAIGYFNLENPQKGIFYLNEAARLNPDDFLLGSHVNALKIRMSEIEKKQSIHSSMPKNMTILVADDSATVRKLISGKLEKCGHEVVCAVDGVDALEKLEELVPDLILLDINMPRMDGYQVCKLIRGNESTKDVPVVMISGKDGFFDKVRGRMAGTTGYITKPFGPETLMKTVETYINQPA